MTARTTTSRVMAQYRYIGKYASAVVCRGALAAALTIVLIATPTAALHAAAAGAGTSAAAAHLYWTNDGGVTVGRASLDGSQVNNRFVTGGVDPQRLCGVAIAGKYLYWGIDVPTGGPAIGRAKLDGTGVTVNFIPSGGDGPVCGVAVAGGHIYWASYANGDIGRANLDGTGVNHQFISGLASVNGASYGCSVCDPNGLAIAGGYIYWGDAGSIGRAKLDGIGVNEHFITGLYFPVGVAVTSKYIYWTDQGGNFIGGPNHPSFIGRSRLDGTAVQRGFIK